MPPPPDSGGLAIHERAATAALLCRVGQRLVAIPLKDVVETMRPLAIEPMPGSPAFVSGVSVIRGRPVPVLAAMLLLGERRPAAPPGRFVTVICGERQVALAVEEVLGVRSIAQGTLEMLPPLLRDVEAEIVAAIGSRQADLLVLLDGARLAPESLWVQPGAERPGM